MYAGLAYPVPGDARQHRPIPEISWLLGLSLQLKLKYKSSQASSLCVSERKTVPECVMETVGGGLFSGNCAYVGEPSLQVLCLAGVLLRAPERQVSVCQQ